MNLLAWELRDCERVVVDDSHPDGCYSEAYQYYRRTLEDGTEIATIYSVDPTYVPLWVYTIHMGQTEAGKPQDHTGGHDNFDQAVLLADDDLVTLGYWLL